MKLQAPRTLTPDQQSEIVKRLQSGPKGPISVVSSVLDSTDAKLLAESIKEALGKSGFTLSDRPKSLGGILAWDRPGAWILVKDLDHPPPHAASIQRAFAAIGIFLEGLPKPNELDADTVVIAISSHPL